MNEPRYIFDFSTFPPSFFPRDLDRSRMVNITSITDQWMRYLDPATGAVHDGAVYVEQSRRETEAELARQLELEKQGEVAADDKTGA